MARLPVAPERPLLDARRKKDFVPRRLPVNNQCGTPIDSEASVEARYRLRPTLQHRWPRSGPGDHGPNRCAAVSRRQHLRVQLLECGDRPAARARRAHHPGQSRGDLPRRGRRAGAVPGGHRPAIAGLARRAAPSARAADRRQAHPDGALHTVGATRQLCNAHQLRAATLWRGRCRYRALRPYAPAGRASRRSGAGGQSRLGRGGPRPAQWPAVELRRARHGDGGGRRARFPGTTMTERTKRWRRPRYTYLSAAAAWRLLTVSVAPLRTPLRRRKAAMTVHPKRATDSLPLLRRIPIAVATDGPGPTGRHHERLQV